MFIEKMKRLIQAILFLLPIAVLAEYPANERPMYGEEYEPSVPQNAEISRDVAQRAWTAYYAGDFAKAMRRFNQAWMYDRKNPEAYWGFGLIMGKRACQEDQKQEMKESIRFLEMAAEMDPENGRILGDLALSNTLLGCFLQSEGGNADDSFKTASELFSLAYELDAEYPPIVANWSIYYFYTENYVKSKSKAEEAIKMGFTFAPEYLDELNIKLTERTRR
jgi:tetratricopeptide (TPR) repeat protein